MARSDEVFVTGHVPRAVALGLLSVAGASWIAVYFMMSSVMGMSSAGGMPGGAPLAAMSMLFASLDPRFFAFFLLVWVAGMVAMMFPAMLGVVSAFYGAVAGAYFPSRAGRASGLASFLAGYLSLYALLGVGAYFAAYLAFYVGMFLPSGAYVTAIAGGLLIAAGVWQLTPLKDACLSRCVSPIGFFYTHAKSGYLGALRMGMEHGYYCVGCCFLYMLVMLGVAAMSLPSMALLAAVIVLEKVIVKGATWFTRTVAVGFIALGVAVWAFPGLLAIL
jgi:predicted metal-binding membrane protein